MPRNFRDISGELTTWAITNHVSDFALDVTADDVTDLKQNFGTLINELIKLGILHGSVS